MDAAQSNSADPARLVAVIDIGANLVRMVIAEVLPDGSLEVLEQLKRAVRLGHDTFRRGRISTSSMRSAISILRDFRQKLDFYQVTHVRAVATSSVREARNVDMFLDRVTVATSIDVEVIDTAEESRLTVAPVCRAVQSILDDPKSKTLIADVGGGSALLTVMYGPEIIASQSLPLGSIRLPEMLATVQESPEQAAEILKQRIQNVISNLDRTFPIDGVDTLIFAGGDARLAAKQVGKATTSPHLFSVKPGAFEKLVKACLPHTPEELASRYRIPFADAETLNPALLVYRCLLDQTGCDKLFVSRFSMRDGLLLDLSQRALGLDDPSLTQGAVHAAISLAMKYQVDLESAQNLAQLACGLFDELLHEHRLDPRNRLLLHVAALLQGVGHFISTRSHHKHSHYIISNSEIFGLSRDELTIVAHVARYHRRSAPKSSHAEYMMLTRQRRMTISKLAAMLRVADALNKSHGLPADRVWYSRHSDELIVRVAGVSDLSIERRNINFKADLFQDMFGLRVRLEEEPQSVGWESGEVVG